MLFKLPELIKKTDNLLLPHKGIVVDNNDPKKLNRVKCIIKGIMESDDYSKLPWIQPILSNSSPSGTSSSPPEINTELWVEFPFGKESLYQPIYRGYWYSEKNGIANPNNPSQNIFGTDYPNIYGSQDSTGNYYFINKKLEILEAEHSSGDHVKILKNGDVIISGKHNIQIDNEGTLSINNKGSVDLISNNSSVTITSETGNINLTALTKVIVTGTAGVDVIGSIVKLGSNSLTPIQNGVITGTSPCILAGVPHTTGSSTVLASS